MKFDIISITEAEASALSVAMRKLLRTAQKKKNELKRKLDNELEKVNLEAHSRQVDEGSILMDVRYTLRTEYDYQVDILREQLEYDMSVQKEKEDGKNGGGGSGGGGGGGDSDAPYRVDYSLSYVDRYVIVRDYYMTIADPNERLELYRNDKIAYDYLGSYYGTLFNYLATFIQS